MKQFGYIIIGALVLLQLGKSPSRAASADLTVSATIPSWGYCWFTTTNLALNFGALDAMNPVDVTASTSVNFRCLGFPNVTYYISDDDGLNETGPNAPRMRHTGMPGEYLSYELGLNPVTGTVPIFALRTLNITGIIRGSSYQAAFPGSYSDSVVLTIQP